MFIELVFTALPIDRDDVEEALETAFAPNGEVTGAGTGMGQCHLDLEIDAGLDPDEALTRLDTVLTELGVETHTKVYVRD